MNFFKHPGSVLQRNWIIKSVLIMKLTIIIVLMSCLQVGAKNGYSQSVTLNLKSVNLKQALVIVEKHSEFRFLYSEREIASHNKLDVNVTNAGIQEVMAQLLAGTSLSYKELGNNLIVIIQKNEMFRDVIVSGNVTDNATGKPLTGVTIQIKGTKSGTTTDANGNYSINVPDEGSLVVTSVNYDNLEIPVNGRSVINISMQVSATGLNSVVVVGYGTQKKKDLTGAIDVVDMGIIHKLGAPILTDNLQGQAAGVNVISSGQPGKSPLVRIRGINTFGDNTPLYVVDGVPTSDISTLNPYEVTSMQVLKDAASASIYGSRAANGVIIITTRKGKGKMVITYDGAFGVAVPPSGNVYHLLSPQGNAEVQWLADRNSGINPTPDPQYGNGSTPVLPDYIVPAGASEGDVDFSTYHVIPEYTDPNDLNSFVQIIRANKSGTDWFHEIYKPAFNMNHNLSVSGSTDKVNYLFAIRYLDQNGTLSQTYNHQYSIRANTEFRITDHFRIGENLNYTITENPSLGDFDTDPVSYQSVYRMQPIVPVYDVMGNFAGGRGPGISAGDAQNVVAQVYRQRYNKGLGNQMFGNVFGEVDFLKHFTLRTSFGGDLTSGTTHQFVFPTYENVENTTSNTYTENSFNNYQWTWTNTLAYQQTLGKLSNLKVMIGTEANENKVSNMSASRQDYFSFDPNYVNLNTGTSSINNSGTTLQSNLFSYFAILNYSYDDKYLFSGTLRRDGSSKFLTNQWGWFPAASVGWRISSEHFMQNVHWISDLKLRADYGIMGNQINVVPNNSYTLYQFNASSAVYPITGSNTVLTPGFQQLQVGNPDAKWEKDINTNIGIDASLFGNKLEITADYYWKNIDGLLYNPALLATQGAANAPYVNVAQMKNRGLDFSITTHGNLSKKLQYTAGINFTTYKNEIVKVSDNTNNFSPSASNFGGGQMIRNEVGHPISSFYGYKIIGFWNSEQEIQAANAGVHNGEEYQDAAAVGRFRYADLDGDGQISPNDRTFLGSPNPDFTFGINIGLNYGAFDLSMFFFGSQGNDAWNNVKSWTDFSSNDGVRSETALNNSWTPENHNAKVAIEELNGSFSSGDAPNSYFVENASYLKLKNLQVGYTLPTGSLQKIGFQKIHIYLQATNLFTITPYSGVTPEIGGTAEVFGVDKGLYPVPHQYIIGINAAF